MVSELHSSYYLTLKHWLVCSFVTFSAINEHRGQHVRLCAVRHLAEHKTAYTCVWRDISFITCSPPRVSAQ